MSMYVGCQWELHDSNPKAGSPLTGLPQFEFRDSFPSGHKVQWTVTAVARPENMDGPPKAILIPAAGGPPQ